MRLTTEDYKFLAQVINARGHIFQIECEGPSRVGYQVQASDEQLIRRFSDLIGTRVHPGKKGFKTYVYGQEFINLCLMLGGRLSERRRTQLQAAIAWWEQMPQSKSARAAVQVCSPKPAKVAKRSFWSRLFKH